LIKQVEKELLSSLGRQLNTIVKNNVTIQNAVLREAFNCSGTKQLQK